MLDEAIALEGYRLRNSGSLLGLAGSALGILEALANLLDLGHDVGNVAGVRGWRAIVTPGVRQAVTCDTATLSGGDTVHQTQTDKR